PSASTRRPSGIWKNLEGRKKKKLKYGQAAKFLDRVARASFSPSERAGCSQDRMGLRPGSCSVWTSCSPALIALAGGVAMDHKADYWLHCPCGLDTSSGAASVLVAGGSRIFTGCSNQHSQPGDRLHGFVAGGQVHPLRQHSSHESGGWTGSIGL